MVKSFNDNCHDSWTMNIKLIDEIEIVFLEKTNKNGYIGRMIESYFAIKYRYKQFYENEKM